MNYGIIGSYSGDSFKNLIRKYSNDRMSRDRRYREQVIEIVSARRAPEEKEKVDESKR